MSDRKVKTPFVGARRGSNSAFSALSLTDPDGLMSIQGFDPNAPKQAGRGAPLNRSGSLSRTGSQSLMAGNGSRRASRPLIKAHSANSTVSVAGISRMTTGASSRRISKQNRPKVARHATQLDMLRKLKRMAPFDKAAEHEYLVNMYKLRGSYVSHGKNLERVQSINSGTMRNMERRGSFTTSIFEGLQKGLKLGVNHQELHSRSQHQRLGLGLGLRLRLVLFVKLSPTSLPLTLTLTALEIEPFAT